MRYDKYAPKSGGFRAPTKVAVSSADAFTAYGVGLDATGATVRGIGNTGIVALQIAHGAKNAGAILDNMTAGECVEAGFAPGTKYTANTVTGVISNAAASATQIPVGFTVEGDRLIVRVDGRN